MRLFAYLHSDKSDLYFLTFDEPLEIPSTLGIYDPQCTWAEGRNLLLAEARKNDIYAYFIFLDDDAELLACTFADFEVLLDEYQPYLGVPLADVFYDARWWCPRLDVQEPIAFDQIVQAYSRQAVQDGVLVPFVTDFDSESWHYSCEINHYLALAVYRKGIAQFNTIRVRNTRRSEDNSPETRAGNYRGGLTAQGMENVNAWIASRWRTADATLLAVRRTPHLPCRHQIYEDFRFTFHLAFSFRVHELAKVIRRLIGSVWRQISSKTKRHSSIVVPCIAAPKVVGDRTIFVGV